MHFVAYIVYTPCPEKRDQQYFAYNYDKFKCITVIFGKQRHESNAKVPIQQLSTSPH